MKKEQIQSLSPTHILRQIKLVITRTEKRQEVMKGRFQDEWDKWGTRVKSSD